MANPIAHIIPYTTLLILAIIITGMMGYIQEYNNQKLAEIYARNIATIIARKITEGLIIAQRNPESKMLLIIKFKIPNYILNQGYIIQLILIDDFYAVSINLSKWKWIKEIAKIPVNATSNITMELSEGYIKYKSLIIKHSYTLISGATKPVIWIVKNKDGIKFGIGVIECKSQ